MPKPVAVITGLGGLTSLGITLNEHLAWHQQAKTGIRFNNEYPYPLGAVPNFNPRDFIKDKKLIIHNAIFDLGHLNNELSWLYEYDRLKTIIGTQNLSRFVSK